MAYAALTLRINVHKIINNRYSFDLQFNNYKYAIGFVFILSLNPGL